MRRIKTRQQLLTRRTFILGGIKLTAIAALSARLYYLQFLKTTRYQIQAEDNRINLQILPPSRGIIEDRNRQALAENLRFYRVLIKRRHRQIEPTIEIFKSLSKMLKLHPKTHQRIEKEIRQLWVGHQLVVKEHLSWDEVTKLEFHTPELPGVYIETGEFRHYPLADKASHLIGYVGAVSEKEMEKNQPVLKIPGFKIGKDGVEKRYESRLRGDPGLQHMEVNVKGLAVRELERRNSIQGDTLRLTLDAGLQRFCADRLGEESGAAVVMNVHTGEVLALVSTPAFDPNTFSVGITHTYWNELRENPKTPLLNKALAGQYPPGSTFKMLVGLAGLEAGLIHAHSSVYCPGHFFLGNHRFNCWKAGGHGHMNLVEALTQSCDTYFYTLAKQLGIKRIAEMCHRFGLGESLGIEVPGERSGLVPTPEWKKQSYQIPWQGGDTINVGIGQGYVLATPLQLATMTARMVNGGRAVLPHIIGEDRPKIIPKIDVNPKHLELVMEGMYNVVNSPSGTAYGKRIQDHPIDLAGKTGTSQVRRITKRGVDQSTIPWEQRHHGLFVGYGPTASPQYACAVIVEHGGGGSSAAAPVVKDIFLKLNAIMHGTEEPTLPEKEMAT